LTIPNHIQKVKDFIPGEMTTSQQALVLSTVESCLYTIGELQATVQELKLLKIKSLHRILMLLMTLPKKQSLSRQKKNVKAKEKNAPKKG